MALIKCEECGRDVSTNAARCPNCGNRIGRRSVQQLKPLAAALIIFFGIGMILVILVAGLAE